MAIYAVIADLKSDARAFHRALKSMDSFQAYTHLWFVSSLADTPEITRRLADQLSDGERLFVCHVTDKWVSIRTAAAAAWLNARGI